MRTVADDKFLTIRLTAELHEQISRVAEANERTIAAEVRLAIRDRVALELDEEVAA